MPDDKPKPQCPHSVRWWRDLDVCDRASTSIPVVRCGCDECLEIAYLVYPASIRGKEIFDEHVRLAQKQADDACDYIRKATAFAKGRWEK